MPAPQPKTPADPKLLPVTVRKRIAAKEMQIRILKAGIERLRRRCCHKGATYLPDPSGNNDSEYYCDGCGGYFRHRPDA